uniref:Uncharacterized protein n=1 Tax=Anguilla anguilla TaxID=7936 RepID=A0A0E9T8K6_ANGAN
MSRFWRQNMLI